MCQLTFHIFQYEPITENRRRAPAPKFDSLHFLLSNREYTNSAEKYFNDNYGFRDILIRVNNQIDYSLFKVSKNILIGDNNWLYYKDSMEKTAVSLQQVNDSSFVEVVQHIKRINAHLKSKDIMLVVMPIPDKSTIYPEFNTRNTIILSKKNQFASFMHILKADSEIHSVDVLSTFQSEKKRYQVFHKTDMHWNDVGATFTSIKTVELLAQLNNMSLSWLYPLKIHSYENFTGGQLAALALIAPHYELKLSTQGQKKYASQLIPMPKKFDLHYKSSFDQSIQLLPKTVVFGNSFTENLSDTGFVDHFSEIYIIRNFDINTIDSYIPQGTQIVIWQINEEGLLSL